MNKFVAFLFLSIAGGASLIANPRPVTDAAAQPACCPGAQPSPKEKEAAESIRKREIGEILQVAFQSPAKVEIPNPKKSHGRGYKHPPKEVRDRQHRVSHAKYGKMLEALPVANMTVYDARTLGIVPPVGDQRQCGDCHLWSGAKVCSSAQMVGGVVPKDGKFMLAVSYLLDCHTELGGCDGGDEYADAQVIVSGGAPSQAQYGGDGSTPGRCKSTSGMTLYTVSSLVFCSADGQSGVAKTQDIKNCILAGGYVSVAGAAGSWNDPGNGTIIGNDQEVDHAIGLVGWDDNHDNGDGTKGAWIMQNQWSEQWGGACSNSANPNASVRGYAWIKYGADSIGTSAFFAITGPISPPPPPPPPPSGSNVIVDPIAKTVTVPQGWSVVGGTIGFGQSIPAVKADLTAKGISPGTIAAIIALLEELLGLTPSKTPAKVEKADELQKFHGQISPALGQCFLDNIDGLRYQDRFALDFRNHPKLEPSFKNNYLAGSFVTVTGTLRGSYVTPQEIEVEDLVFDVLAEPTKKSESLPFPKDRKAPTKNELCITPCKCGCVDGKGCLCQSCDKHTADPTSPDYVFPKEKK